MDIEHLLVSIAQKVEKRTVEIRIKYWLNIIGGGGGFSGECRQLINARDR